MRLHAFLSKRKEKKQAQFQHNIARYPCNDYLNNALTYLLKYKDPDKLAISEIAWCIFVAGGRIYEDVQQMMIEKGLIDCIYGTKKNNESQ